METLVALESTDELILRKSEIESLRQEIRDLCYNPFRPSERARKMRELREMIKHCKEEFASLSYNVRKNFT